MNWLEIAEALQKAPGPSKELSEAIHVLLGYELHYAGTPAYTASRDAIADLEAREFSNREINIDGRADGSWCARHYKGLDILTRGEAATEPLARCAAFARAMHERGAK